MMLHFKRQSPNDASYPVEGVVRGFCVSLRTTGGHLEHDNARGFSESARPFNRPCDRAKIWLARRRFGNTLRYEYPIWCLDISYSALPNPHRLRRRLSFVGRRSLVPESAIPFKLGPYPKGSTRRFQKGPAWMERGQYPNRLAMRLSAHECPRYGEENRSKIVPPFEL